MKSIGNGSPEQCAYNLLRISRGEVPYERLKGLSTATIDAPAAMATTDVEADAEWVVETYEPRVDVNSINLSASDISGGDFSIAADITVRKDEELE